MEEQRAKFEAWAVANSFDVAASFKDFPNRHLAAQHAWEGWQASAAESAAEIERLRAALERVSTHRTRTSAQIDADWDAARAALSEKQP